MSRRTLWVVASLLVGTALGGVVHAKGSAPTVRTCEEENNGYMRCDDDTACFMIGGVWVCEEDRSN